MHFEHDHFEPMQLQEAALKLTSELGRMSCGVIAKALGIGCRGCGLKLAATLLSARYHAARQARMLLRKVNEGRNHNPSCKLPAAPISP